MLEKKSDKRSVVITQTIFYTITVFIIIIAITIGLRVIVLELSLNAYSKNFITQINPSRVNMTRSQPNNFLDVMEQFLEDQDILRKSLTTNKIVILDGAILNNPFNFTEKELNINDFPYLYKKDNMYYIFVGIEVFENSLMIIGGPSLEFTSLIEIFDNVSLLMIIIGSLLSLIISFLTVRRTLKPVVYISKEISKINITNIEKRIPEQDFEEFDILARKLNSMLERIQTAYENQNQFVSDVSHELRTPLTSINGYVKLLKRWGAKDETVLCESLDNIDKSIDYLKNMVEKLLILSKPDYEFEKEQIRVKEVIENILDLYSHQKINFEIIGDDYLIETSKEYLALLLKIILENAIKYSKNYEEIKIDIILEDKIIKIKDYGIGIDEIELQKIFDRFYKSENSRTNKGHGLGLSIAKKIANALEINLEVESIKDKETTFIVKF